MATETQVDGTTASVAPTEVFWVRHVIGTDHNNAPILAGKDDVVLRFDASSPTAARQWTSLEDGSSHTITTLGPESTKFFDLSPVYVRVEERPIITDIHSGPFSIRITNAERPDIT